MSDAADIHSRWRWSNIFLYHSYSCKRKIDKLLHPALENEKSLALENEELIISSTYYTGHTADYTLINRFGHVCMHSQSAM